MILFKIIHKHYIEGWADCEQTASYRQGGRWNSPGTGVMYLSANIQNAMLEIGNYATTPAMANLLYRIAVFEFKSPRLYEMTPKDLPKQWSIPEPLTHTQAKGDELLNNKQYDGFIAPSATLNDKLIAHPNKAIRQSAYSNVVIHIERFKPGNVTLIESHTPVFSDRLFGANR